VRNAVRGVGRPSFGIFGASFDGTNDYLSRGADLAGNADGATGIFVARIRFNGGDGVVQKLYSTNSAKVEIIKQLDNTLLFKMLDSTSAAKIEIASTGTITADGRYHNILCSWDTSADANNHLYIDDASDLTLTTRVAGDIDYTVTEHVIGAFWIGGIAKVNADINFMYFNVDTGIDFSVEANRRKFFNSQGQPVLNSNGDGSAATGTAPIMYFAGDYASWHINKGTGGGLTVTGSLERPLS
jgi:hypothetical protein